LSKGSMREIHVQQAQHKQVGFGFPVIHQGLIKGIRNLQIQYLRILIPYSESKLRRKDGRGKGCQGIDYRDIDLLD